MEPPAVHRTYYEEHKTYILERAQRYYERHREVIRDKQRTYYARVTRPRKGYQERGLKTSPNLGGDLEIVTKSYIRIESKTPISIVPGPILVHFD